jgi:hypothetical protein
MMRVDATFPCDEHVGLRQLGLFTVRGLVDDSTVVNKTRPKL